MKFVTLSKHIQAHPDYQTKVAENSDTQNREIAFNLVYKRLLGIDIKRMFLVLILYD